MEQLSLSVEEIRMLAKLQREMDQGLHPYVYIEGGAEKLAMSPEDMERFGLEVGQKISNPVWCSILRQKIADLSAQIAYEKSQKLIAEVMAE